MKLKATTREVTGKKVKNLRREGKVPATVYGPKRASTNILVDFKEFQKVFREVSYNNFLNLEVGEDKPVRVLIKDIQIHPLKDQVLDVSFYQVNEESKITVDVPIILDGEAPAVKLNTGFLVTQMETVAVHCLPKDLPSEFHVDITSLENPGDAISLSTLTLPEDVEFDSGVDAESAIVYIAAAQKEEVVEEVPAEGEEGAEGATAEGGEATATPGEGGAPAAEAKE